MASLNQVTILGHLGADPETRYTGGGTAVTNIRVATSEQWTDKQSGEKQERTEWHSIVFFGRQAEVAGEYLKKGRQVLVQGQLRTEKYTDKDGADRWTTKIYASELKLLGGGEREGGGNGGGQRQGGQAPRQGGAGRAPAPAMDDDDIPF